MQESQVSQFTALCWCPRHASPVEREEARSDPRAGSQKGVEGSLLSSAGKCVSLVGEQRERIVPLGTN